MAYNLAKFPIQTLLRPLSDAGSALARLDERIARSPVGVPRDRVVMSCYMISGAMAGIAGIIYAGRTDAASPLAGVGMELDAVTAVIIGGASLFGGRGHIVNALIGALIIGVIRNGLNLMSVSPFWEAIAIGISILFALELDVLRRYLEEKLRARAARAMR